MGSNAFSCWRFPARWSFAEIFGKDAFGSLFKAVLPVHAGALVHVCLGDVGTAPRGDPILDTLADKPAHQEGAAPDPAVGLRVPGNMCIFHRFMPLSKNPRAYILSQLPGCWAGGGRGCRVRLAALIRGRGAGALRPRRSGLSHRCSGARKEDRPIGRPPLRRTSLPSSVVARSRRGRA